MMPEFVFFTLGVSFRAWAYSALILSSCQAFFESSLYFLLGFSVFAFPKPMNLLSSISGLLFNPYFHLFFFFLFYSFFIGKPSRGPERGL